MGSGIEDMLQAQQIHQNPAVTPITQALHREFYSD